MWGVTAWLTGSWGSGMSKWCQQYMRHECDWWLSTVSGQGACPEGRPLGLSGPFSVTIFWFPLPFVWHSRDMPMTYFGMSCGVVSQEPDSHPSSHGPKETQAWTTQGWWITVHCMHVSGGVFQRKGIFGTRHLQVGGYMQIDSALAMGCFWHKRGDNFGFCTILYTHITPPRLFPCLYVSIKLFSYLLFRLKLALMGLAS